MNRRLTVLLAVTLLPLAAHGEAPASIGQQGWYADPEIHIFAGQYWIHPTYSNDTLRPSDTAKLSPVQIERRKEALVHKAYLTQTFLNALVRG